MKHAKQTLKRITPAHTSEKLLLFLLLIAIIFSVLFYVQSAFAAQVSPEKAVYSEPEVTSAPNTTRQTASDATETPSDPKAGDVKKSSDSTKVPAKKSAPVTVPSYPRIASASPRGLPLYVTPRLTQLGRPYAISSQPIATWLGEWDTDIRQTASNLTATAASKGSLAVLAVYNIPNRDCGSHSAGGASSFDEYKAWIRQLAAGVGNNKAIIILEPDALAQLDCLSSEDQTARYALLADAVNVLATQTKAFVYIDAGNSGWMSASTMIARLNKANIAQARGFAINVSNFIASDVSTNYGNKISAGTGKSFVIDTSRNGNGANAEWCNPRGRALGAAPTTSVGGNVDAYLWAKVPGESDGACNGGPSAGNWWEEYAQELISNARK